MTLELNHYLNIDPTVEDLQIYLSVIGCNITCPECVVRNIPRTPILVSNEKIIDTVEHARRFYENYFGKKYRSTVLVITGGEPLLQVGGVLDLVSTLPKQYSAVLQTNATLLTPDIADRLRKAKLNNITLTLQDEARYQQFFGDANIRNRILQILQESRPAQKIVIGYWFRKIEQLENILKDIEKHDYRKHKFAIRLMAYVTESKVITTFTDTEIQEIDGKLKEQKIPYILTLQRRNRWEFFRTYFDMRCSKVEYILGGGRHETPL